MSSPLIWFGNAAKFLKSVLVIPGSTSGTLSIQPAAATTSYTITMPAAQGASNTFLTNNGSGTLSWTVPTFPTYTAFTLTNNQTTPANVTGFLVDHTLNNAFESEYSIIRSNTAVSFAEDTAFYTNLGTSFNANVLTTALQSNGQILAGGVFTTLNGNTRNYLVRLNSDGTEDTAFYTNLGTGFNNIVRFVAVQANGQILVGGDFTALNGNTRNSLVRLNSDGTEDAAFYANLGTGFNFPVQVIVVQNDGKILVGGDFTSLNGNTRNYLLRLNSDGTEDAAFYTNLGTGFDSGVAYIALQTNDQILVGGFFTALSGNTRNRLVRLNSSGTEDTAFYSNLFGGFNAVIRSITIQNDGKILVGGGFTTFSGVTRNYLVRLNSDGTEDILFYTNLGTGFTDAIRVSYIQSNGQILIGGDFTTFNGNARNYLLRLNSSGTEDTAFYTNLGTGFNFIVRCLLITSSNHINVAGNFTAWNGNTRNYMDAFINDSPASEVVKQGTLRGIWRPTPAEWDIGGQVSYGDDTGITFFMTAGGQLQYTSTNYFGTITANEMRFVISRL